MTLFLILCLIAFDILVAPGLVYLLNTQLTRNGITIASPVVLLTAVILAAISIYVSPASVIIDRLIKDDDVS